MRVQALSLLVTGPIDYRQRYHGAAMGTEAVRFLVLWMAGWIHSRQLEVIDFLREENCVLREQLGGRRLRTHLTAIAAADFFSVEVLTVTGLVRHLVLFVIDLQTRRVQIGGVVRPGGGTARAPRGGCAAAGRGRPARGAVYVGERR
jgi:hypothetical protein